MRAWYRKAEPYIVAACLTLPSWIAMWLLMAMLLTGCAAIPPTFIASNHEAQAEANLLWSEHLTPAELALLAERRKAWIDAIDQ